jgi:hypothetical protein
LQQWQRQRQQQVCQPAESLSDVGLSQGHWQQLWEWPIPASGASQLPGMHAGRSAALLCLQRCTAPHPLCCFACVASHWTVLLCSVECAVLQATSSLLGRLVEASSSSSEPRCDCWAACRDALAAVACWLLLLALIHDRMRCPLGTSSAAAPAAVAGRTAAARPRPAWPPSLARCRSGASASRCAAGCCGAAGRAQPAAPPPDRRLCSATTSLLDLSLRWTMLPACRSTAQPSSAWASGCACS